MTPESFSQIRTHVEFTNPKKWEGAALRALVTEAESRGKLIKELANEVLSAQELGYAGIAPGRFRRLLARVDECGLLTD